MQMLPIFPALGAVSCVGVSRGTSPQLEGLSQAIAGLVFDRALPRDFGKRERAIQSNQQLHLVRPYDKERPRIEIAVKADTLCGLRRMRIFFTV